MGVLEEEIAVWATKPSGQLSSMSSVADWVIKESGSVIVPLQKPSQSLSVPCWLSIASERA